MVEKSRKEIYSRITTQFILLLQPEHGFYRQDGQDRGQVHDWYPNAKMVVVPVCLNGRCSLDRMRGCCIVLTKMKVMSLCLSRLFEEMLLL